MPRYGNEFGHWGSAGGYDWDRGYGGRGGYGHAGMRPEGWGGEGYSPAGYQMDFGGGYGYDGMMRGGGYGPGYRDMMYGNWDDQDAGRGMGMGGMGEGMIGERGGPRAARIRMRAADIMTDNPEAVTPDTTLTEVAQRMRDLDVGIIPVVDDMGTRRLRGVITDRDIAVRAVAEGRGGDARVADCMTARVETVNKNDSVYDVLDVMQREQVRRVPVTDREGRLVGIIAQADLALDFAGDHPQRERMVEDTLERISEPNHPRRGGMRSGYGMSAGGRGGQGGMRD